MRPSDLAIGLLAAAFLLDPAVQASGLAGSPGAELYGHAWVQWWAAEQWPAWPRGTAIATGTQVWPVVDPLPTWLVAGLAQLVGPTWAWNAWVAVGVVLAAVGGGAFARSIGGSGPVGAAGLATAPIFVGSLVSGLTEDFALGLVALGLAQLIEGRRALGAVLLALSAYCGLYVAWLGAAAALSIGLADALDRPGRWVGAGLLALVLAAPAAYPFRERLDGVGHHAGVVRVEEEPLWHLNPWRGADLASFVVPGEVDPGPALVREHPTYLGWFTVGLAAMGGLHPAWLGFLACVLVAPGEEYSFAGKPLGLDNPAVTAFRLLPFAERFNHHARLMLLGQLCLIGLAARGAERLRKHPVVPFVLAGLVAVEYVASPARAPLPVTPVAHPVIYARLASFPAGPVAIRGGAGPGIHPQKIFFDQRAHGRRLLHNPNRPADGRPVGNSVLVALGTARAATEEEWGEPDEITPDGAAWWIEAKK
ncbi:MAG: hypothetical protein ACOZNI_30145 [Myxococcota bacterium]